MKNIYAHTFCVFIKLDHIRNLLWKYIYFIFCHCFYFRRKPKAKAPLPPADTKNLDASPVDDAVESFAFVMEQKESMIDKDIELTVVLPGDIIKSTTVHGRYAGASKMPGLLFCCHSNPLLYISWFFFFDKILHHSVWLFKKC